MLLTLLTDFGTQDAYVAQMKGQILSICPELCLVDISHSVPPQDVRAGAYLLSQAVPHFPAGTIHLVVVDPGVGTERAMIAVEVLTKCASGAPPCLQRVVLPDNGLISMLLERHQLVGANYLTDATFWRPGVSHTFHGRDIMGPVAAHWAQGASRTDFGPECVAPVMWADSSPEFRGNSIIGRSIFVDHYGNVITNIPREQLSDCIGPSTHVTVQIDDGDLLRLPFVNTYGEAELGQAVLLFGSHGYLELARAGGNAAVALAVHRQSKLRFTFG